MNHDNKNDLKRFFIKIIAITFSIIIIINITYNLIFAQKFENIDKILSLNNKQNIEEAKDKIRLEIKNGLAKDKILNEEDKILLYELYLKIRNEFAEIDKNVGAVGGVDASLKALIVISGNCSMCVISADHFVNSLTIFTKLDL